MTSILRIIVNILNSVITVRLDRIEKKLDKVLKALAIEPPATKLSFIFFIEGTCLEDISNMEITDSQQFTVTLKPLNKRGGVAAVEPGSVVWAPPSFVTLTPSEDGLSATILAAGIGSDVVSVSADADLGEGVVTISGSFPIEVIASQAISLGFVFGQPTEQL